MKTLLVDGEPFLFDSLPEELLREPEPQQESEVDEGRRQRIGNNRKKVSRVHKKTRAAIAAASRRRNRRA